MPKRQKKRKQKGRVYWKDGLRAFRKQEEIKAVQANAWHHAFGKAQKEVQTEDEAIVFLGADAIDMLTTTQPETAPPPPTLQPPPVKAVLSAVAVMVLPVVSYILRCRSISGRMQ